MSEERSEDVFKSGIDYTKIFYNLKKELMGESVREYLEKFLADKKFQSETCTKEERKLYADYTQVLELIKEGIIKEARTEKKKYPSKKEQEELIGELGLSRYFKEIKAVLKEYMDMEEGAYTIVSLWILGTYLHKQFSSYPYLFFNAMKGSGKSRILNIIANLSKNGKLYLSVTKAGIYRSKGTYCLDEFEGVGKKGNEDLRELINGAYKRGGTITRYDDVKKNPEGEDFNIYRPVAMANIWGMENVLADRCIKIILEKSARKEITRLIENFENNIEFQKIRRGMLGLTENFEDDLNFFGSVFDDWNNYVKEKEFNEKFKELFSLIGTENIEGRNLEILFPLFIIADIIGKGVLKETIEISKKIIKERKESDREENRDIQIYEFVAGLDNNFFAVSDLVKGFKEYYELSDNDDWANSTWLGKGLRRLNLVVDSRRKATKREIKLNIEKAKKQTLLFKEPEDFKKELQEVLK